MSAPNTPGSKRALLPRSPCGVKIFNPPTCSPLASPLVTESQVSRRSPSPVSGKTSGSSSQTHKSSVKYLCTSRSSSPPASLSNRNSLKQPSRATSPSSPMFAKLFSARHSAYSNHSSRESIAPVSYHKLIIIIILIHICRGSLMKRKVLDLFSPVLPVTTLTCLRHLIFHPAAPPLSGFLFMFLYWRR